MGREHMLAIVSDEPLGFDLMPDGSAGQPFRELTVSDLHGLRVELVSLDVATWSAAELSFDVLPARA